MYLRLPAAAERVVGSYLSSGNDGGILCSTVIAREENQ